MKKNGIVLGAVLTAVAAFASPDDFRAGFARLDITPPDGVFVPGYFTERYGSGADTPLVAECLALAGGGATGLVFSVDNLHLPKSTIDAAMGLMRKRLGVDLGRIFIASTHIHTGPATGLEYYGNHMSSEEGKRLTELYGRILEAKLADTAAAAVADFAPSKLAVARTTCTGLSFIRRFRMKDGTVRTNPSRAEDIDQVLGQADESLQLVRFRRQGAPDIALVNFACHPDTVGGSRYHADWPGVLRTTFERALADGTHCFFLNGAQGDTNHYWQRNKPEWRRKIPRHQIHVHMGLKLAGAALGLWETCEDIGEGKVRGAVSMARVPSNRPTAEEMRYLDLYDSGRVKEIPLKGMELTTLVSKNGRARKLRNGPDYFDMPVSTVTVGGALAFVGYPGEPFAQLGTAVKEASPFKVTLVGCLVNGSFGYLPSTASYQEGGYEVVSSRFAAPVGDVLIKAQLDQLRRLFGD